MPFLGRGGVAWLVTAGLAVPCLALLVFAADGSRAVTGTVLTLGIYVLSARAVGASRTRSPAVVDIALGVALIAFSVTGVLQRSTPTDVAVLASSLIALSTGLFVVWRCSGWSVP